MVACLRIVLIGIVSVGITNGQIEWSGNTADQTDASQGNAYITSLYVLYTTSLYNKILHLVQGNKSTFNSVCYCVCSFT